MRERVIVKRNARRPLPPKLAVEVNDRARELGARLDELDKELGHRYPTIIVQPTAWLTDTGTPWAKVVAAKFGRSLDWAVEMPGSTLIAVEDQAFIDGILAHEYLHYVYHVLLGYTLAAGLPDPRPASKGYMDHYKEEDKELQVEPAPWLSPRLAGLLGPTEDDNDKHVAVAQGRLLSLWRDRGGPVTGPALEFEKGGSWQMDYSIFTRAKSLQPLLTRTGRTLVLPG